MLKLEISTRPCYLKIAAFVLALLAITNQAVALEKWPRTFVRIEQVPIGLQTRADGQITVLDARKRGSFLSGHIPGAQNAIWTRYRAGWFRSGRLPTDLAKLAQDLGSLGIDDDKPVLVCGNALHGWGEEGRIAWMIRYLGHPAVAILDGGCNTWGEAGRPITVEVMTPIAGAFTPRPRTDLRASTHDVTTALTDDSIRLIDVRTTNEFRGATPYFASRGGHIPTAVSIPFRSFVDDQGRVKKQSAVMALLKRHGIAPEERIIVYCTGGVRSGFVVEILSELGVDAANYDASFWAWSADHSLPVTQLGD